MPFDSNGNANIQRNRAVTGQTVEAAQVNVPFDDVQSMLSQVLVKTGVAPMEGTLNMNGFPLTGLKDGVVTTDAATVGQLHLLVPPGSLIDYAGTNPPAGWLLCYGQEISRTAYSALFAAIGTIYGAGNNSTTFNIPDMRGRVGAGLDAMGGTSANRLNNIAGGGIIGATGGSQTHTLTVDQLASHNHGVVDPGHSHSLPAAVPATSPGSAVGLNGSPNSIVISQTAPAFTGISISNQGSNQAHNNIQPTMLVSKIIKV